MIRQPKPSRLALALIPGLVAGGVAGPATAQTLEEVVITAQKREQSVQDVGISVSAFTGKTLDRLELSSATEISAYVPGVHVSGSYAGQFQTFTIRGVTQNDFLDHTEAPNAVYVDDGYLAAMNSQVLTMFDVDRVEVLKGPQGTLFGRNATGGAVSIITRKPSLDEADGYVDLSYGNYDALRAEAAYSTPVSENVAIRFAGVYDSLDSVFDNRFPGGEDLGNRDVWGVRGHLLARLTDDVELWLSATVSEGTYSSGPYQSRSTRNILDGNGLPVNSIEVNEPTLIGTIDPDGEDMDLLHDFSGDDVNETELQSITGRLDWSFENFDFTSITDFRHYEKELYIDADATEVYLFNTLALVDVDSFTQEFRFYGESDGFRWTTGFYYLYIDNVVPKTGLDLGPIAGGVLAQDEYELETTSSSLFAQLEYDLSESLTLVGGLRATREEKEFDYRSGIFLGTGSPLVTGPLLFTARTYSGDTDDTLIAGKLQLDWRLSDETLVYLSYNRGIKAGSFNAPFGGGAEITDDKIPYDEEVLNAYEVGLKSDFLEGRMRFNASAFFYDYNDYQAFQLIGLTTQVENKDAEVFGLEAELTAEIAEGFTLFLAGSYLDTEVSDVTLSGVTADRETAFTPETSVTAIARYELPLASGALGFQGEVIYTGDFYYSLSNFDSTEVPAYTLGNLRLDYRSANDRWELNAFLENLSDERYATFGFDLSGSCGCSETAYGMPRTYGVGFRYNFLQ